MVALASVLVVSACSSSSIESTPTSSPHGATDEPAAPGPEVGSGPTTNPAPMTGSAVPGVQPTGVDTTRAVVTAADGTTCELCVWLADTASQRSQGLMFVTDLGVGDAMAFRYPESRTGTFWMKNTPLPLSIAFFAPDGAFMSSFDMEPCTTPSCPKYRTAEGFLVALEVPQGELAAFGVGPGSSLELLDLPCA